MIEIFAGWRVFLLFLAPCSTIKKPLPSILPRVPRITAHNTANLTALTKKYHDTEARPALPRARTVFFVSDGTGITAETFGHAVLSQFEMRFPPDPPALHRHARQGARRGAPHQRGVYADDNQRPIVFSTLVKHDLSA
jgi:hypothetical protein